MRQAHNRLHLEGQAFSRWTVVERADATIHGVGKWTCRCVCGGIGVVRTAGLTRGRSKSCGCLKGDVTRARNQARTTHGHTKEHANSPTYSSWRAMKRRCQSPSSIDYPDYGGRGITVCERWLESFDNFLADMGERPAGTSIDRIDNDGNYEPNNCRWATATEQACNRVRK